MGTDGVIFTRERIQHLLNCGVLTVDEVHAACVVSGGHDGYADSDMCHRCGLHGKLIRMATYGRLGRAMVDGVDSARCDHGNVASCAWCIVRKQGDELLLLRAALREGCACGCRCPLEPAVQRALDGSAP